MKLTTAQLMKVFNITQMTLYNWRMGTDKKKTGRLPAHFKEVGQRHRVYFKWAEVKRWAVKNNVEIVVHPDTFKNTNED